ncbi:MAG: TetR/AcrR family transcriptional regulator [Tissierellia bacterium]|nr:TetR/AcrR family transcriptional regulator [Tissierellia bacterium]
MPKIIDYDSKREEIIEKSKIVFAKHGYYNTNLSLISKKCGMGRTTLYQYFENKDDIFYHTVESTLEEINAKVDIIMADENLTFVGKIKEVIHQLTKDEDNNYVFMLLLEAWLVLNRQKNEFLENLKVETQKLKGKIEKLIVQAIEAKEIKPVDSKSLATTIYTFIETFTLNRTNNNMNKEAKAESLNLLIDGLMA